MLLTIGDGGVCYVSLEEHRGDVSKTTEAIPEAVIDWQDDFTPIGVEFLLPPTSITEDVLDRLFTAAPFLSGYAGEWYTAFATVRERQACIEHLQQMRETRAAVLLEQLTPPYL